VVPSALLRADHTPRAERAARPAVARTTIGRPSGGAARAHNGARAGGDLYHRLNVVRFRVPHSGSVIQNRDLGPKFFEKRHSPLRMTSDDARRGIAGLKSCATYEALPAFFENPVVILIG